MSQTLRTAMREESSAVRAILANWVYRPHPSDVYKPVADAYKRGAEMRRFEV